MNNRLISKHDKMNPLIWLVGSFVDPRIRVNGLVKSIFPNLEGKGMFVST